MKVNNKEGFIGYNSPPSVILFPLDATVATSKFGTKRLGNPYNFPVIEKSNINSGEDKGRRE